MGACGWCWLSLCTTSSCALSSAVGVHCHLHCCCCCCHWCCHQAGLSDPDIFFTDRPRESGLGQRNKEYVSIWADDCPVLPAGSSSSHHSAGGGFGGRQAGAGSSGGGGCGPGSGGPGSNGGMRTPLQCYYDFMVAFRCVCVLLKPLQPGVCYKSACSRWHGYPAVLTFLCHCVR
jgi:hypothetical protein